LRSTRRVRASDAIRENDREPPDLLVTDLGLPGLDGFGLLHAVRTKRPNVLAVAVTAYARYDDRVRTLAAGFQAHLAKPIDPHALVRALAAALSRTD
jgi:CheY-like chemotaxis protein